MHSGLSIASEDVNSKDPNHSAENAEPSLGSKAPKSDGATNRRGPGAAFFKTRNQKDENKSVLTATHRFSAVETLTPECHAKFTSKHLSKVLDRCFTSIELDDHTVAEEKEKAGQAVQVERVVKGLVSKCLEKDAIAFKSLGNTKSKSKEYRLTALSECRPEGCGSAVDLFLWLVEVRSDNAMSCRGVHFAERTNGCRCCRRT